MNDRKNTIAGWVLFAGIVALGASIVTGEIYKGHAPEKGGFPIEGAADEGGDGAEADKPFAFYLASADLAKGEQLFKKCTACHNVDQGGANALGPNLWGVVGAPHAMHAGFAYSDALKGKPGNWDFEALNLWLKSPKTYAPGTKMTFAGMSNPQERADLIAWLNTHGSNVPLPAAPAEAAPADAEKAAAENAVGGDAEKAENEPVLNEAQAEAGGKKNSGGEVAPATR